MSGIQGFDEQLSEDEEKLLREQSEAAVPPPASSEGEDADAPPAGQQAAEGEAKPGEQAPAATEAAATTDVNAAADAEAKESFEAFAAKHKDRAPEELLRLAFDKEQARKVARHDAKEARQTITDLRDGVQKRMADLRTKQEREKAQFNQTLAEDPDKAAQIAFERTQEREREEAETEEFGRYVATQTEISRNIIPNFDTVAPDMVKFGVERIGYDLAMVQNAHDARDMVALYMACQFDKLVQAGVVGFDGSIIGMPAAAPAGQAAPAAAAPPMRQAPKTLGSAPGASGGAKTLKDQAQDLLSMNDNDFEKAMESGLFDQTLRGLTGGSQ